MIGFLILLLHVMVSLFKTQAQLKAEIVLLRHQLSAASARTLEAEADGGGPIDLRLALSPVSVVLNAVTIIQPETVIRWHRTGFRLYWCRKSRSRGGRPRIPGEIRRLIRT